MTMTLYLRKKEAGCRRETCLRFEAWVGFLGRIDEEIIGRDVKAFCKLSKKYK